MIGRYVARARGRALRAAGVPRFPNVPSARALAQRELREAARLGVQRPPRRASHHADVPAADNPVVRTGDRSNPASSPYDDPSRDVGEGPDVLTRSQALMLLVGFVVALYLLLHPGAPPPAPSTAPPGHCHACD